jgi:hypothetical protein
MSGGAMKEREGRIRLESAKGDVVDVELAACEVGVARGGITERGSTTSGLLAQKVEAARGYFLD